MKHRSIRILCRFSPWTIAALLACALPTGCAKDGQPDEGVNPADSAEFSESVPDVAMLSLALSDDATESQALTLATEEQALAADPATIQARAQEIVAQVNAALVRTKDALTEAFADVAPIAAADDADCRIWEKDGARAHWRLRVCVLAKLLKHYGFKLEGRPLASTVEADYLLVMAGEGKVLPKVSGARRGAGRIGFDLDHLATLRGDGPTGKIGFGYRAAGRARLLTVGLRDFVPAGGGSAVSALYRFWHVLGKGGRLAFTAAADFVTKDGDGKLIRGQDGQVEQGRAVLAWVHAGAARAVAAVCNGTVGDGLCVHLRECWRADGTASYDDVAATDAAAHWDQVACPGQADLIGSAVDDPPTAADLQVPATDGADVPGPAVEEPAADASLE